MSKESSIVCAIVGRPNVGKSTLFNRLISKRKAIETPIAGTTRDRLYGDVFWRGNNFQLVDTAGILNQGRDEIEQEAQESTKLALAEAEIILFIVDFRSGVTDADLEISKLLRKEKNVILVVNKYEATSDNTKLNPFKRLGIDKMILVSAISGKYTGDLLDLMHSMSGDFQSSKENRSNNSKDFNLSIIGRPNAGKSTLLNTLTGEKKMIVSSQAGTTRDSQEFIIDWQGHKINLVDTAGIRRKSRVQIGSVEGYALLRSFRAINDADVIIYVVDAQEGVVSVDQTILGEAERNGKSIILAINKIDNWKNPEKVMAEYIAKLRTSLNFMPWLPVIFISAKESTNVKNILNQAVKIFKERNIEIPQEDCDEILTDAKDRNSQINYIQQLKFEKSNPVVFKILTKKNKKPHFSHLRYLENCIRDKYPLNGNPLFIDLKRK